MATAGACSVIHHFNNRPHAARESNLKGHATESPPRRRRPELGPGVQRVESDRKKPGLARLGL